MKELDIYYTATIILLLVGGWAIAAFIEAQNKKKEERNERI